jgi:hypothetical protein
MSMRSTTITVLSLALVLAACGPGARGDDAGDDSGDDSGDDGGGPDAGNPPSARCQAMDIMFVVDDSGSMQEEQSNLATNFPQFATILDQYQVGAGQPLDYRVAVTTTGRTITTSITLPGFPPIVTTEQGDNGAFRGDCQNPRRWIERSDGNLASTLSCRANVGTSGPGTEMPLYASMLALGDRVADGTNAGFLRDDALLAVVMLTDEDDCSTTETNITLDPSNPDLCGASAGYISPQATIDFFDNLKGDRGRWATAVIAGPTNCTSAFGDAANAAKLQAFISQTNTGSVQNGIFSSICEGNLAPALQAALDTFQAACESFPPVE